MQYKVPQNISMEDRIAGPFTLVQFSILVVGGGLAFLILNLTLIAPLNQILAGILALITALLAIGRFNDQPMYLFFKFILYYLFTPRIRVWHKAGQDVRLVKPVKHAEKESEKKVAKHITKTDIARLAVVLDSRGTVALPPKIKPPR